MNLARYRFSPEGTVYLIATIALAVVAYQYTGTKLVLFLVCSLLLVVLYIFRDAQRDVPCQPLAVISPIDGEIVDISQKDSFGKFDMPATKIKIRGNRYGCYVLRGPTEGKVCKYWSEGGMNYIWIKTDEDDSVAFGIEAPVLGRSRIYAPVGERIGQGRRMGFAPVSAEVDVIIAGDPQISAALGDRVRAGESIIGTLRH